jgi:hypothetical protein
MVINANFSNISVISVAISFIDGVKPENPEKTTDLSQVIDKFYHNMYTSP